MAPQFRSVPNHDMLQQHHAEIPRCEEDLLRVANAKWVDLGKTKMEYSSVLTRISREYHRGLLGA
jgi:hypothetical protein